MTGQSSKVSKIFGKVEEVSTSTTSVTAAPATGLDGAQGAGVITPAQVLGGVLAGDPEGSVTWVMPSAVLMVAAVENAQIGTSIDFYCISVGAATGEILTIGIGANGTLLGLGNIDPPIALEGGGSGKFRIRFSNVTSGAEAYDLIHLS